MKRDKTLKQVLAQTKDYHIRDGIAYRVFPDGSSAPYYRLRDYVVGSAESGPQIVLWPR